MLSFGLAGGLGFEPRLTESESLTKMLKNRRNVRILRFTGRETGETDTAKSGYFRHKIVTVVNHDNNE